MTNTDQLAKDLRVAQARIAELLGDKTLMGEAAAAPQVKTAVDIAAAEQLERIARDGRELYGGDVDPRSGGQRGFLRLKSQAAHTASRLAANITADGLGRKAILGGGSSSTSVLLDPVPVAQGQPAGSLLDLVPAIKRTSPTYRYLRQTTRTNAAATVAPGAAKPVSVYTLSSVDAALAVVAHLSEPVDSFMLTDTPSVQQFIQNELAYGLVAAVEALVVSTLAGTSGVQAPVSAAFSLGALRSAITLLQTQGLTPTAFFMHPSDWERTETAADDQGRYQFAPAGAPIDVAARRVWSVPVGVSTSVTSGTPWLVSDGSVELSTDAGVQLRWSEPADLFTKNQVQARCEGRYHADVPRPIGVVKLTLT